VVLNVDGQEVSQAIKVVGDPPVVPVFQIGPDEDD
jgi:hypothetical protein